MSAAAMLDRLQEQQVERVQADAAMARAAYDRGEISWNDLKDVVTHLALTVLPDMRVVDVEAAPAGPKKCACGAEIPARYRKCDDCLGGK